ncbi:thioredoxin family protein [Sphingobacteriaceae bacterium]|nr:thioredoxin family protein [Sphingobacteriaceae bacterium]
MITKELLDKAMSYAQYRSLLEDLLAHGKTTGPNQSEEYIAYAKINLQRMQRLEKTINLEEDLKKALLNVSGKYLLLIITEGWCGDAAQNLPIFHLIEKTCEAIELKLILRDEHLEIMDRYLTNGARSIPKVIFLDKITLEEKFVWGPRPSALQEIVVQLKKENKSHTEKGLITQNWYNADKTKSLQNEILKLVRNL